MHRYPARRHPYRTSLVRAATGQGHRHVVVQSQQIRRQPFRHDEQSALVSCQAGDNNIVDGLAASSMGAAGQVFYIDR